MALTTWPFRDYSLQRWTTLNYRTMPSHFLGPPHYCSGRPETHGQRSASFSPPPPPLLPFYPFFASSTLNCSYSSCPYVQKATRRLVVNSFTEREKLSWSRSCHFSSWIFNFTELHSSQQFEHWIDGTDSHAWFHLSLSLTLSRCAYIHTYIYIYVYCMSCYAALLHFQLQFLKC